MSGLTLIAIIGIKDLLRQDVPKAIAECKRAGIKVRMITGDNKVTARAIAIESNIIEPENEEGLVLEGTDFAEIVKSPKEFNRIYRNLDVLARSRPQDKLNLVAELKKNGNVVAVTGSQISDAPSLKKADVGFAMGIEGTDVAKDAATELVRETSDIILLDDSFSSIVKAVLWGRNIFDTIRNYLQFQLTVNLVIVGITLISAAITKQEVFAPVQMLWINLIINTFASLAYATEPPNVNLLIRKPFNINDSIINKVSFTRFFFIIYT